MTDLPQPQNQGPYAAPLAYGSYSPHGNARTLVLLAGIFNCIVGGLNILYALVAGGAGIAIGVALRGASTGPSDPPVWLFPLIYGIAGVLALVSGIFQAVAGMKFLKKRRNAATWGLVVGIVSCLNLWCSWGCVLPMASGIFTIVASSMQNVKAFLRDYNEGGEAASTAFPVNPPQV